MLGFWATTVPAWPSRPGPGPSIAWCHGGTPGHGMHGGFIAIEVRMFMGIMVVSWEFFMEPMEEDVDLSRKN